MSLTLKIHEELGHEFALLGMSRSYYDEADDDFTWWQNQKPKAYKRAKLLCVKTPEHAKFLRAITVNMTVKATRAFWQEYATYKVGSVELSASTMHKLDKREPTVKDFSSNTPMTMIVAFQYAWHDYKVGNLTLVQLKDALPEGYLQTRDITINYATLRNIISQRKDHRYLYWRDFVEQLMNQIQHPELLEDLINDN